MSAKPSSQLPIIEPSEPWFASQMPKSGAVFFGRWGLGGIAILGLYWLDHRSTKLDWVLIGVLAGFIGFSGLLSLFFYLWERRLPQPRRPESSGEMNRLGA